MKRATAPRKTVDHNGAEKYLTPEEALVLLKRVAWQIGDNPLEDVGLFRRNSPLEMIDQGENTDIFPATHPEVTRLFSQKVNFGKPTTLYLENEDEEGNFEYTAYEIPAVVSIWDILMNIQAHYQEMASKAGVDVGDVMMGHRFFEGLDPQPAQRNLFPEAGYVISLGS